jgi:cytochrome c oxidase subunit II
VLAFALVTLTAGCNATTVENLGLRNPLTTQAKLTVSLWQGAWIAALAVGAVVWGMIIWSIIFYRKKGDRIPRQVRYNLPIEIMYTVIPFIMVGVLFYFTARDENRIDELSAHPNVVVNVVGSQWTWTFQYPQYPVRLKPSGVGDVTEIGQMWNGIDPGNESSLPLLEIPDHETVRFNLYSIDVIHSFWVLPFDFKRDVIPGHPNHFQVNPIGTLYSGPDTIGRCSELCGLYHSRMLFRIKIVTPAQFRAWILGQQRLENATGGAQ